MNSTTRHFRRPLIAGVLTAACLFMAQVSMVHGAGLLVADGGFGGTLEIRDHEVEVVINSGIAVTTVTQVFHNTESRQLEALYTFPVPKGASISNFSMWIEGKEMVGEVLEKERARQIYDSYKNRGEDPGLLEQVDYKRFEMRVFPIAANADQKVQIVYYQELDFDYNWATYLYPLETVTDTELAANTAERFAFSIRAESSIPVSSVECPSHGDAVAFSRHDAHHFAASLETRNGNLDGDLVIAYKLERPQTGLDLVTSRRGNEDGYFQLTLTAGEVLNETSHGMDYVFITDISGSMNEAGKMRTAKHTVGAFVTSLNERDRLEVIAFNIEPKMLFDTLQPTSDDTRTAALQFLDEQKPRGSTLLDPAIRMAYRYREPERQLNVVVISDGMTKTRERRDLLQTIARRPDNTRVFCVGVGNEVNRPLLEQLAMDTGGLAAFVSNRDDFNRQARGFRRALTRPAAANVKIDFADIAVYDVVPQQLPDLYYGSPIRVYGRYRNSGRVNVKVSADVEGHTVIADAPFEFPAVDNDNPELERMWAWHKVDMLLKQADRNGTRAQIIPEIVRLGEGYGIATEYTSFLVLENDQEYRRWKIARHNVLRLKRERAAEKRVLAKFDGIRDRAMDGLGPNAVDTQLVDITPVRQSTAPPGTRPVRVPTEPSQERRQSRNISFGGGSGPVGLLFTPAVLLLAWLKRRRSEDAADESS